VDEPIIPEHVRRRQNRLRSSFRGRQLSLIAFTLAAIAGLVYAAYYFFFPKEEQFVLGFYTYAQVETADFLETLSSRGVVIPRAAYPLESEIAGHIAEVFVEEGQYVQAGDPILRLSSEVLLEAHREAENKLMAAERALEELEIKHAMELESQALKVQDAQAQVDAASKGLALDEELYGLGAIAKVELEKAEQDLEAAKRQLRQSEHQLELLKRTQEAERASTTKAVEDAKADLAKASEQLAKLVVYAPISGRVLSLSIPVSHRLSERQQFGEIADPADQMVELEVSPNHTELFAVGSEVEIRVGQQTYAGQVAYVAPQARQGPDGAVVTVRVDFLEDASGLLPNTGVNVDIRLRLHKDSPALPRGPYLTSGQQLFVYVIEGERAVRREVQFGLLQGSIIQVLRGLDVGERVITSSYDAFRHLEEITILPEGGHKQ
jgi:HlyD family secretion protein